MARPLLSRKTDLCLLIFFCLHTFFVIGVDCLELYPAAVHSYPPFPHLLQLRQFYIDTYQDKFLSAAVPDQQPWFVACTWMEFLYHVPTCVWAVWGLYREHALVPLALLPWAVQTFVTTLLCVVELWNWEDRTTEIKWALTGCYGPYLVVSAWVASVMYGRLKEALLLQRQQQVKAKGQ